MRLAVFTSPMCKACHDAMDYLKGRNYTFQTVDISIDKGAQEFLRVRTGGKPTTPAVYDSDSGRLVVGFTPGRMQRFLDGR